MSASRCLVVDADLVNPRREQGGRPVVRIHNFAALDSTRSAQALTAELRQLLYGRSFSRRAWVNLWDIPSVHRYMLLPAASDKAPAVVAAEQAAAMLHVDTGDLSLGVAESAAPDGQHKIAVSFFGAATEDIQTRLRVIRDAGFTVEGVVAPGGALWSMARLRRRSMPGEVHAYVCLGAAASALAFVANDTLLYARELNWGYAESFLGPAALRSRDDLASRLAGELRLSSLYVKQFWEDELSQLLICGDMPEIRSLTGPLIERLNIEVETLDTLDGIDTAYLTDLSEQFADRAASLRMAAAIAAAPPPVNLLPVKTLQPVARTNKVLLAAASAAALALFGVLYQWPATRERATAGVAMVRPEIQSAPRPRVPSPAQPHIQPPPAEARITPSIPAPREPGVVPATGATGAGPIQKRQVATTVPKPQRQTRIVTRAVASGPDPVVHTILYSSQHKVALVDSRIVRVGDHVGTSVVSAIEPDAVVLITELGETKRLALEQPVIVLHSRQPSGRRG